MILIDTGPLVALCDQRDSHHRAAVAQVTGLIADGLVTCEPVLVESCFHLPHPAQRARLSAVVDELRIGWLPAPDAGFRHEVFGWLLKYADHAPDWADGCLAVLCGRDARLKVWTYDREFRTRWRKPDGRIIPLAVRSPAGRPRRAPA